MNTAIFPAKRSNLHLFLLAASVLAVFGNTLLNGFVWDDNAFVLGREVYRDFDLAKILLSPANGAEYLPLRDLTLALDYAVWGERPYGFHLTNLLLHLCGVLSVYHLVLRLEALFWKSTEGMLLRPGDLAFITAVLFAVHPVQSQAVSFVAARNSILSAMFAFLAAALYCRSLELSERKRWAFVAFGALLYLCSLLSKSSVITLPIALSAVWFLLYADRREKIGSIVTLIPYFVLSVIFYFVHSKVAIATHIVNERLSFSYPLSIKIATALQIPFFYLAKLLLPTGLSPEYDVRFASSYSAPAVIGAFIGLVVLTVVFVKTVKALPIAAFGIVWFLGTLIPVLNFYVTNPTVADRYAYLPSFGFFCAIGACIAHAFSARERKWMLGALTALILVWSGWTMLSNGHWKNEKTLWERTIHTSPQQQKGYVNLAVNYFAEGERQKAFELLEKAKGLGPLAYAHYDLFEGYAREEQGDYRAAIIAYKRAIARQQDFVKALFALAEASEAIGDIEGAVGYYNRTMQARTENPDMYRDRVNVALARLNGKIAPRLGALKERLAANPSDQAARIELAVRCDQMAMYEDALAQYQEFIKHDQGRWDVYFNLGNVCKKLERRKEASEAYRKALALSPAHADSWNNLGSVLRDMKEYDMAIDAFKNALAADPSLAFASYNLGLAYFSMGDREAAVKQLRDTVKNFPALAANVNEHLQILEAR